MRKGRIAAETLSKPLTFFEAVEALRMPKTIDGGKDKKPKVNLAGFSEHHMITKIDLSGFKSLRFSKAGL